MTHMPRQLGPGGTQLPRRMGPPDGGGGGGGGGGGTRMPVTPVHTADNYTPRKWKVLYIIMHEFLIAGLYI